MARKVTNEDIVNFNELYLVHKTYAEVARQTGFSASTVKKYIIPEYTSKSDLKKKVFHKGDLPEFAKEEFFGIDNWGDLCLLSKDEEEEIVQLWNELLV